MSNKKKIRLIVTVILSVLVLATLLSSMVIVNAGNTGVIVNLGAVSDTVLTEGFHFKVPFVTQVVQLNARTQIAEAECSAASRDLQTIKTNIAVNYHIDKTGASLLYKNVGVSYETTIIQPAIQESVKAVIAQFSAEELITKRQDISLQIKDELTQKIAPYGLLIEVFNITNLDFSEEFNKAIEAKQTAQQNALKAEQDLVRVKTEAQQQIEQAKAEAEALRIKKEQISDEMIKMEWIKKWDGKLPIVSSDGNIIDVSDLLNP